MLICDKRRPARARGYQYQAPPRGPNKDSPPGLRPAPRAPLAWGGTPPAPWAAPPGAPFAHRAPAASSPSRRGSGTGAPVAGVGNRLRLSMPDAQLPGGFRASGKFKRWAVRSAAGVRGRAPVVGRRWATRPRRWAARVQPQAVPAVHGLGEVVHGRPGSGRSGSSEQSNRANIFSFAQPTRAKPRQYWVSREPLYKNR